MNSLELLRWRRAPSGILGRTRFIPFRPLLVRPAAASAIWHIGQNSVHLAHREAFHLFVSLAPLLGARRVAKLLVECGHRVLPRLMGLITMVIAVELFFGGLT